MGVAWRLAQAGCEVTVYDRAEAGRGASWAAAGMLAAAAEIPQARAVVTIAAPRVYLCWWGAACNLTPSSLQASYLIPGFHVASIRHIYQFTIMRMVAERPVVVSPQMVSAALTNTQLKYDDLLVQR